MDRFCFESINKCFKPPEKFNYAHISEKIVTTHRIVNLINLTEVHHTESI